LDIYKFSILVQTVWIL